MEIIPYIGPRHRHLTEQCDGDGIPSTPTIGQRTILLPTLNDRRVAEPCYPITNYLLLYPYQQDWRPGPLLCGVLANYFHIKYIRTCRIT